MAKKKYSADIDFYSMELQVTAKNKTEARKKAKALIARKIKSHINGFYIDEC